MDLDLGVAASLLFVAAVSGILWIVASIRERKDGARAPGLWKQN